MIDDGDDDSYPLLAPCDESFTLSRHFLSKPTDSTSRHLVFPMQTHCSVSQTTGVLERTYKTVITRFERWDGIRGFHLVWEPFQHSISDPTQIDESSTVCSGYEGTDRVRQPSPRRSSRSGCARGGCTMIN